MGTIINRVSIRFCKILESDTITNYIHYLVCDSDPPPAPNGTLREYAGNASFIATYTCINTAFGIKMSTSRCNGTWEQLSIECPSGFVTSMNLTQLPITCNINY